ncbi:MAG: hypothetical protein ACYTGF_06845 [Planctomycetota bacterium]
MSDPPPVKLETACAHIRHKLMYCAKSHAARGMVDDSSDTRVFFCVKTFEALGPDDQPVSPGECAPGRSCFCAGT